MSPSELTSSPEPLRTTRFAAGTTTDPMTAATAASPEGDGPAPGPEQPGGGR